MSDLEMPDEDTAAEMDGDEAADAPRAKDVSHRQSALRDLSRARKQMRSSDESGGGGGAELLMQSAMVKALLDLADAIREGRRS